MHLMNTSINKDTSYVLYRVGKKQFLLNFSLKSYWLWRSYWNHFFFISSLWNEVTFKKSKNLKKKQQLLVCCNQIQGRFVNMLKNVQGFHLFHFNGTHFWDIARNPERICPYRKNNPYQETTIWETLLTITLLRFKFWGTTKSTSDVSQNALYYWTQL